MMLHFQKAKLNCKAAECCKSIVLEAVTDVCHVVPKPCVCSVIVDALRQARRGMTDASSLLIVELILCSTKGRSKPD